MSNRNQFLLNNGIYLTVLFLYGIYEKRSYFFILLNSHDIKYEIALGAKGSKTKAIFEIVPKNFCLTIYETLASLIFVGQLSSVILYLYCSF